MKYLTSLICLSIILLACGDNITESADPGIFGYEYYPVSVGNQWVYQVDSVKIGQGGSANEITSRQIREVISEIISEDDTEAVYRLERSSRKDSSAAWRLTDVWTIATTAERLTKTIENLRFIKLVFPAVQGARWDGNVFFDDNAEYPVGPDEMKIYQNWIYRLSIEQDVAQGDTIYGEVATVSHIDEEDLVGRRFSQEKYAKGTGLIYRKMEIFDTPSGNQSGDSWIERAEKGFMLEQTLISSTIQ